MRRISLVFITCALTTWSWTGCLKKTAFSCADDPACGSGGVCEPEGFCSIASGTCDSGREFSDTAGNGLAGQCVGGGTPGDAPEVPDGPPIDMPTGNCDASYLTIAGGTPGHKYKFVTSTATWSDSHDNACVQSGGYLAIPTDAAELAALDGLTSGADAWVGLTDGPTNGDEGTFKDSLGNAYTIPGTGIGFNNAQPEDCALMKDGANIDMKPCIETHEAVCECDD